MKERRRSRSPTPGGTRPKATRSGNPLFLAFMLSCGCGLLLVPAIIAIPPYVALEYLGVGATCVATVLVTVLDGRSLSKVLGRVLPGQSRRQLAARRTE